MYIFAYLPTYIPIYIHTCLPTNIYVLHTPHFLNFFNSTFLEFQYSRICIILELLKLKNLDLQKVWNSRNHVCL